MFLSKIMTWLLNIIHNGTIFFLYHRSEGSVHLSTGWEAS